MIVALNACPYGESKVRVVYYNYGDCSIKQAVSTALITKDGRSLKIMLL